MTWRTHMLAGMSSVWLLQLAPGNANPQHFALWLAVAAIGALLPDLDAAQSKIKHLRLFGVKPFHHLSLLLNQTLGHRGLLHSCIGLGLIMLLALYLSLWWGWQSSLALVLGYASHLVTDACTRSGIPWLYPHLKRYHLLPKPWRIVTGSLAEEGFFCLLLIAVALLLLWVIFSFVSTGLTPWNGAI